jgi:hypothetical protein
MSKVTLGNHVGETLVASARAQLTGGENLCELGQRLAASGIRRIESELEANDWLGRDDGSAFLIYAFPMKSSGGENGWVWPSFDPRFLRFQEYCDS